MTTNQENKCAHPACSCAVPDGERFCSTSCEISAYMASLSCSCEDAACETLAPAGEMSGRIGERQPS